jgi:ABC-type sulfate transport system substrate-binding protein
VAGITVVLLVVALRAETPSKILNVSSDPGRELHQADNAVQQIATRNVYRPRDPDIAREGVFDQIHSPNK